MEHRCGQRIPTDVPVSLVARPAALGFGRILNVSATGAYIQTNLKLRLLTLVHLEALDSPFAAGLTRRVAAYVVRHCVSGIAVEWCEEAPEWVLLKATESHRDSASELIHDPQEFLLGSRLSH
jgi:hypothetical protein